MHFTSLETLEYSRAKLRAHTNSPVDGFSAFRVPTHARVADMGDNYNNFVFFGGNSGENNKPIDAGARLTWDASTRNLMIWYWTKQVDFEGVYLSSDDDAFALSTGIPSDRIFNGFSLLSTDRNTSVVFGNVVRRSNDGGMFVKPVELPLAENQVDRLVRAHFDVIVSRKLEEIIPRP